MVGNDTGTLAGRLRAETIRQLEQHGEALPGSEQVDRDVASNGGSVEHRIIQRARQLATEADIGPGLQRVRRYARMLGYGATFLAILLGALAALQAFDQGKAVVNFYWLLLVLLGLNLFSLLLWLFGLLASNSPAAGALGQSGAWLLKRWVQWTSRTGSNDIPLAGAWLGVMLNGAQGRWTLSSLGHALWASYLVGGLGMILILLAARQYDFVWATTLLGEQTFIPLTQALAWLPTKLGLASPSLEQISHSRLGADPLLLAEARRAWAGLLISSLLLYGIVPRLLLLGLCRLLQRRALRNFRLDTSRPYYVRLRQRLVPAATSIGVVDADDSSPVDGAAGTSRTGELAVPDHAAWLGIELDPDTDWPPLPLEPDRDLGRVSDRDGQHRALGRVEQLGSTPLALALPMQRSPDRGLARFIGELASAHPQATWLVLLDPHHAKQADTGERDARMVDWYALAAHGGIEADHISQLLIAAKPAMKGTDNG